MTSAEEDRGTPAGMTSAWQTRPGVVPAEGYLDMVEALRMLHDELTAAAPPAELVDELTRTFTSLSARLRPCAVGERRQIAGHLSDAPGRGQALVPALYIEHADDQHARGRVTFGRYYLGGNGAAHGGAIPLVFDELLGRLANTGGRPPSRTAYLNVNFRRITPIGAELRFEGHLVREEGRKRFLAGTIHDGDTLCADAEGLFVALRPGQP